MPEQRGLSRLEMAILGLISTGSPCTPYWIRMQFQSSASSHFSGSAGAVYPAIRRLEAQGYARGTGKQTGTRKQRNYGLTRRGKQALRDWLMPSLPLEDIRYSYDPIRTRVYYLDALRPEERLRFVDDAIEQSESYLAVVKKDCEAHRRAGDLLQYGGVRGVLHEVRARIRWLRELRRALVDGNSGTLGA
jgi:DNA-binding PadR family transcriptional regulator